MDKDNRVYDSNELKYQLESTLSINRNKHPTLDSLIPKQISPFSNPNGCNNETPISLNKIPEEPFSFKSKDQQSNGRDQFDSPYSNDQGEKVLATPSFKKAAEVLQQECTLPKSISD